MLDDSLLLQQVGWFSIWILGLSVGFTTCTAVCMPYLGSWALSRGEGAASALKDTGMFALGKIAAYATLGGIAGMLGNIILVYLKGGIGHYLIGITSAIAGLWLLRPGQGNFSCSGKRHAGKYSPVLMGYALSFTPCAPLAALLAASASAGDGVMGFAYGIAFGLGAALTPLFIVIPLIGSFGHKLQQGRPWMGRWLKIMGGSVLLVIGLNRIWLGITG